MRSGKSPTSSLVFGLWATFVDASERVEHSQRYRTLRAVTWIVVAFALILLLAGLVAVWSIMRSPIELVLVPDAIDVQFQSPDFNTQRVIYRTTGKPYGWYFTVVRRLSADGWSAPVTSNRGIQQIPEVHWRISSFVFMYLEEKIALQGDPTSARITMRRRLIIPWRRYFQ